METLSQPGQSLVETSCSEQQNSIATDSQRQSTTFGNNEGKSSSKKRELKPKTPLKEFSENEIFQRLSGKKTVMGLISPKEILENIKVACMSSLKKKKENEDKENIQENAMKEIPEMKEKEQQPELDSTNPQEEEQEVPEKTQNNYSNESDERNGKRSKTPAKTEVKVQEVSNTKSVKSLGKVALMYHKCGVCQKNMILGKEKTKLLSCTHRFHEDCINGKNRCFLCDGVEAYDARPSEKSLKKNLLN